MLTKADVFDTERKRIQTMQRHPILAAIGRAVEAESPTAASVFPFAWKLEPFVVAFHYYNATFLPTVFNGGSRLHQAIRGHAKEDAQHMTWYYQDLEDLGQAPRPHAVHCVQARVIPALEKLLSQFVSAGQPLACLAVIEAVEETGVVFFKACADAANAIGAHALRYFAQLHFDNETGSMLGEHAGYGLPEYFDEHQPGESEFKAAIGAIETVFDLFTEMLDDLVRGFPGGYGRGDA